MHVNACTIHQFSQTTCKDYAAAYIFSPSIASYKGKKGPEDVLDAMRQLSVSNLPPASETGRCDAIMEIIKKAMTDARHNIKEKILLSIKDGSTHRDIAALTRACIGTSKARPTAALFIRIAFLRYSFVQYPTAVTERFWNKVDETLAKYRLEFKTPVELQAAFVVIFDEDKLTYGEPDLVSNPQVVLRNVDEWLMMVNRISAPPMATPASSLGTE
ncbi:hypothetical protein F5890DRAFT_1462372 [Lentinula detonsa]|uniref:Uncharacterized protein n=1 Tax=Lentinula detonsa TaxID=2804962 RepID=A0AA38UTN3_9AGAR|nr:hypothetical protein F5890DRAFT_1462372 [Lentinula detonsa]